MRDGYKEKRFWGEKVKFKAIRKKEYSVRKLRVLEVDFVVENDLEESIKKMELGVIP